MIIYKLLLGTKSTLNSIFIFFILKYRLNHWFVVCILMIFFFFFFFLLHFLKLIYKLVNKALVTRNRGYCT